MQGTTAAWLGGGLTSVHHSGTASAQSSCCVHYACGHNTNSYGLHSRTRISAEDKDCLTWIGQGSGYCECTGRQTVKRYVVNSIRSLRGEAVLGKHCKQLASFYQDPVWTPCTIPMPGSMSSAGWQPAVRVACTSCQYYLRPMCVRTHSLSVCFPVIMGSSIGIVAETSGHTNCSSRLASLERAPSSCSGRDCHSVSGCNCYGIVERHTKCPGVA